MNSQFLYDPLGRSYPRKNLYLSELWALEESTSFSKRDIKKFKKNKGQHPYILELKAAEEEEKLFLKNKKNHLEEHKRNLSGSKQMKDFLLQLEEAKMEADFYHDHVELSYDFEYKYKRASVRQARLDDLIQELARIEKELQAIKAIDSSQKLTIDFKEERAHYQREIMVLRRKRKEGLISKKALARGKVQLKEALKHKKKLKRLKSPSHSKAEELKSKSHERKLFLKSARNLLRDDLAETRRRVPLEVEKNPSFMAYLSLVFPGLGQLANAQLLKASLFFLAGLLIYLVAIPYALGFGNYQGQGIAGLISLAQGGKRTDRSIIFMIEGIIALVLLVLSLLTYLFAFLDSRRVARDSYRGIRPKNWFETKKRLLEEGFPYLVSLPALFVLIFIVLVPIATTLLLSFTNMGPKTQSKFPWVGLSNYKLLLAGQGLVGSVFWKILIWTLLWTIGATSLAIFIGFMLALLAHNPRIKGKGLLRTIYLLPWAVPAFITIMFFSIMFSTGGEMNLLLSKILGRTIDVKNNMYWTRFILILLQGWLGSSYVFLLSTGVLQAIPEDLYEAADIDGANTWQKMTKITLPMVLFQTAPLLVNQYTFNFNNFSIIYLFNGGGPFNPLQYGNLAGSSDILISYIYKLTINNQYQSIGAAVSIFISLALMFLAFLGYRNTKAFKEERL